MNPQQWASVKALLQSALERSRGERERYLQQACADEGTRHEVESLLAAHEAAGGFLESKPRADLRQGTRLGPYEIVSLIGSGGMGEVYRARDTRIGRDVAIKRLPENFGGDPERLRRFDREVRLAGSLNHPNLVTIHDVGTHEGARFVVMEFLPGETLRSELSRHPGPLPDRRAFEYGVQIANGLAAAHEHGVVHRDLKPENIFITKDGQVKILDFGLAKAVQPATETASTIERESDPTKEGVVLGTVAYMSPEQVSGETLDVRSDIFSFGVIVYEMLSGKRLFKRDSAIETMHAIVTEEVPPLSAIQSTVPVALDWIVQRCLEKKPAARFQSARDIAYALEAVETSSNQTRIGATSQERMPVWAAVGVAGVLIAIVAAGWAWRSRTSQTTSYERLTFRRGTVTRARFGPDGETVIFAAAWDGDPVRIFVKRPEDVDVVPLDMPPADLLSVSRSGELAVLLNPRQRWTAVGTLARASINGGSPRPILQDVTFADWSPDGRSIAVIRVVGNEERLEIRSAESGALVRHLFTSSSEVLHQPRFSPSGDRIAFAAGTDVLVMKSDGTERTSFGTAAPYSDLVWSPDGREVWFAEGTVNQTTVRAVSMSSRGRTVLQAPGFTTFSDAAGTKVLIIQNDISVRVSCLARGATAERDLSWRKTNRPVDITADGRQVLLQVEHPRLRLRSVGLQPLDGSPITELAQVQNSFSFSADERSVLVAPDADRPSDLALVPIGPGERVSLQRTKLEAVAGAVAAPNGKSVILVGVVGGALHLYEKPLVGPGLRRITEEPMYASRIAVSPDSAYVAAMGVSRRLTIYRISDGKPTVVGTAPFDDFPVPIRFADDGSLLYASMASMPTTIHRFDIRTGEDTVVRKIAPADRAGVVLAYPRVMTADAQCYCYDYAQILSRLVHADRIHARW